MKIKILETSDIHSYISTNSFKVKGNIELFSMSRVKTYIDSVRNTDGKVIYIDNGDNIQGSMLGTYYHDQNNLDKLSMAYNMLGPDAMVLGNHDFNYGKEYLKSYIDGLDSPVLSANTVQDEEYLNIKPYVIKEIDGIRIGILGLTTQYIPHWEHPKNIEGLSFKSALDTANYYVPILKNEESCDIVIVSYHGGFAVDLESGLEISEQTGENEGYDLLYSNLPIDVLLTGHTHLEIAGIYNNVAVIQPLSFGAKVGEVILDIDDNNNIIKKDAYLVDLSDLDPDKEMEDLVLDDITHINDYLDNKAGFVASEAKIESVALAQTSGHPYINLINQIMMYYADTDISSVAIYSPDSPGFDGEVTMRDVVNNYVFTNSLMKIKITGNELREILEYNSNYFMTDEEENLVRNPKYFMFNYDIYSGIDYTYDFSKDTGHRLTSLKYKGNEVKDNDELFVATNNYRAVGGGDFPVLDGSQIVWESEKEIPDLIFEYIANHDNIKINDYPSVNVIGYKSIEL